ncbi:MAG: hypothetical protein U0R19_03860 [Bryobacteraceae bacterium]
MNIQLSRHVLSVLAAAPLPIQKAFIKQLNFLTRDLKHPGLHAKKYDESRGVWQARVNDDWRFWFEIDNNTYYILDLAPHPK